MHELLKFAHKTVVLTGAASGIGKATLELLALTEAEVHAVDLARMGPSSAQTYQADLGKPAEVDDLVGALPDRIDCLLNCAGLPNGGRFSPAQIMAVNWFGLRMLTESVLQSMPSGGSVVHVASTAGRAWPDHKSELGQLLSLQDFAETLDWIAANSELVGDGYALSKEAVVFYTLNRSTETIKQDIRMNSVSPGVTETPIADDFRAGVGDEVIDRAIEVSGRIAQPEEMAPALLFLADERSASYINGVNLTVDRGVNAARTTGRF